MKFDVVQAWLDNVAYSHSKSDQTAFNYRYMFERFCQYLGCTPQQILDDYEGMNDREFKRKYARLLRAYIAHIMKEDYAVGSVTTMITPIKSFFKYNDLPLGFIPAGSTRVTYHNRDITGEEIAEIMKISNPRERAFFCVMAQSGLRPDTLCSLKLKHVEPLDTIPEDKACKITVPENIAKGKYGAYFTFIGPEAVRHLRTYLLKRPNIKPDDYLFTSRASDKRLNPKSVSGLFTRAIEKLKDSDVMDFEQKNPGKPRNVRLYNLRKWFRKQAGHAGPDFVNFWMGHTLGVDAHYFSRDPEHHRKRYEEQAMVYLRIEAETPDALQRRINEQDKKIESLNKQLEMIMGMLSLAAQGKATFGIANVGNQQIPVFKLKDKDAIEVLDISAETLAKAKEKLREIAKKRQNQSER